MKRKNPDPAQEEQPNMIQAPLHPMAPGQIIIDPLRESYETAVFRSFNMGQSQMQMTPLPESKTPQLGGLHALQPHFSSMHAFNPVTTQLGAFPAPPPKLQFDPATYAFASHQYPLVSKNNSPPGSSSKRVKIAHSSAQYTSGEMSDVLGQQAQMSQPDFVSSSMPNVTYSIKPGPVFTVCPPTGDRIKGALYLVHGTIKKWDGKRFARCCRHPLCTKFAQGPTSFCKAHGGGTRCKIDGCHKAARGASKRCVMHGGGRRCVHPECTKGAVGPLYCKAHGGGRPKKQEPPAESQKQI